MIESTSEDSIYPKNDDLDPQQARNLYENHCAIFILEDLPIGNEIGIDLTYFKTGEKFKGIKLIPPGLHFIYASETDKITGQSGPRTGLFHDFKSKEILVKRWSVQNEDFDDSFCATNEVIERYRCNLRDLDRYLGAYRFSTYVDYIKLTNMLSPSLVKKMMPDCDRIRSIPYLVRENEQFTSSSRRLRRYEKPSAEENLLPNLKPDQKTLIHFSMIHENHLDCGQQIDSTKVTEYHLDTTTKLEQAFPGALTILLGEFQFAFLVFILCHVYECFERWKMLLHLVCCADTLLNSHKSHGSFHVDFIITLRSQFNQIPQDMFEDIVDSNNLVRNYLDTFFQNIDACNDTTNDSELTKAAYSLKSYLKDKFNWEFDQLDEQEEDLPVIVEL